MSNNPEQYEQFVQLEDMSVPVRFNSFPLPNRAHEAEQYASAEMDEELVKLAFGGLKAIDSQNRQEKVNTFKEIIILEDERDMAEHIADTDPLTLIPNRRGFRKAMATALDNAQANNDDRWSLFFLDLDGFKGVNDTFGHEIGDEFLKAVAYALRLRKEDIIGRFGGDEFLVFAKTKNDKENKRRNKDISEEDAKIGLKNKIRQDVEAGAKIAEEKTGTFGANVSASIGEVPYTGTETVDDLIKAADKLMAEEKKIRGRRSK